MNHTRCASTILHCIVCVFGLLQTTLLALQEPSEAPPDSFQQEFQKIFGKSRTIKLSAAEYLRNLVIGESNDAEFLRQIVLLGSENYQERQDAEAFLFTVPVLPEKYRADVEENPDMEVRYRLKSIFAHRKNRVEALIIAALKTLAEQKDRASIETVFALLNSSESLSVRKGCSKTIEAIADAGHSNVLEKQLESPLSMTRLLSARLIVKLKIEQPVEKLNALMSDDDEQVGLAVSMLLIDLGHKPAVSRLVELLSSQKLSIASRSERILRAISGEDYGHISYSDKGKNTKIAAAWNEWKKQKLASAKLNTPIRDFLKSGSRLNGNTLIAKDQSVVIELNENNEEIFRLNAKGVLSAEKTLEGNYLLFSYSGQWLKEYSPEKKVNWEITGLKFNNAMPLDNGNVLVSIGPSSIVREIEPATKKTVWEYKTSWWPNDAFRLENGNTLIGGKGGVVEVTPENKIVWEYKNPDSATIVVAKPTVNDGVLVGWTSGLAREVDREKKTVWEYKAGKLSDVFRDSNGHTLVATSTEIIELDPEKKIIWRTKKQAKTASVRR